jgi:hypothetical protein
MLLEWFSNHIQVTFLIIFVMVSYVYNNVFRTRKLPILKSLIVYFLIAMGSVMLLYFQLLGLPIVICLAVAIFLMFLVRIRYFIEKRASSK